jgi:hypothetical protein
VASHRTPTLFQAQHLGTEVYRDVLAREVHQLGYEITERGERGEWELKGYDRNTLMKFSQRREQLERALSDTGIGHGAHAQQLAAYRTRAEKRHANEHELQTEGQERAQGLGLDVRALTEQARARQYERPHEHEQKHEWTFTDTAYDRERGEQRYERNARPRSVREQERAAQDQERDRGLEWGR